MALSRELRPPLWVFVQDGMRDTVLEKAKKVEAERR